MAEENKVGTLLDWQNPFCISMEILTMSVLGNHFAELWVSCCRPEISETGCYPLEIIIRPLSV